MPDDRIGSQRGFGRDDAWFSPATDVPPDAVPPRGVVYSSDRPDPPPRRDPYEPLREIDDGGTIWPLEDPGTPPARPRRSGLRPFLVGLAVGVTLAVVSVLGFQLLRPDEAQSPATVPAAGATILTEVPPTTTPVTSSPTATTVTTLSATTTSLAPPPEIVAVGTPLAIEQLRLAANAIGPIQFGSSESESLGRLVASLGPPDGDTGPITSTGELGTCAGDTVRVVRWGPLAVVTVQQDQVRLLAGYRMDLALGGLDARAATISTLSGLRAGDTVGDMVNIYEEFTIDFVEEPELGVVFELRRPGEADLLLWGPVTSEQEDGRVTGIFAPDSCQPAPAGEG